MNDKPLECIIVYSLMVIFAIAIFLCGIAFLRFLLSYVVPKKLIIKIKLPKAKRFIGRHTPIYEIYRKHGGYYVRKFVLDYHQEFTIYDLWIFWPTDFYKYYYKQVGEYWIHNHRKDVDDDFITNSLTGTPESLYERYDAEYQEKYNIDNIKTTKLTDKLNSLNSTFNSNYIK